MKKQRLYFSDLNKEFAYPLDCIISEMKDRKVMEVIVYLAKREIRANYFFCKAVGEVCIKDYTFSSCGKECDLYEPRNGKNGCCKSWGYCYSPDKEFILSINGKLTPKKQIILK